MAAINYITADLELTSRTSLDRVVAELDHAASIHLHEHRDGLHSAILGVGVEGSPEQTVSHVCGLLEGLSPPARRSLSQCTRRVVDVAFESGSEPLSVTYTLPADLVRRVADLGLAIAVTLYRTGSYSDE